MRAPTRAAVRVGAVVALVVGVSLAMPAPRAFAHALLIRATPSVNGTVASSPRQLLLTFTEPVDPTLSHVQMVDAGAAPCPACRRLSRSPATRRNSGCP